MHTPCHQLDSCRRVCIPTQSSASKGTTITSQVNASHAQWPNFCHQGIFAASTKLDQMLAKYKALTAQTTPAAAVADSAGDVSMLPPQPSQQQSELTACRADIVSLIHAMHHSFAYYELDGRNVSGKNLEMLPWHLSCPMSIKSCLKTAWRHWRYETVPLLLVQHQTSAQVCCLSRPRHTSTKVNVYHFACDKRQV